jgi:PAS domain-containing protein
VGAWDALDSLAEGVLTTDLEGRIVYVNQTAENLLGKPTAEAMGRTLPEVIHLVDEADRKALADPVRRSHPEVCARGDPRRHHGQPAAGLADGGVVEFAALDSSSGNDHRSRLAVDARGVMGLSPAGTGSAGETFDSTH